MRYTIITPTILRPSLKRACHSIDQQTNGDWEHLVAIDSETFGWHFDEKITKDARRRVICCGKRHNDGGSSCRYNLWEEARGDYILYLDDDNFYADNQVLETLMEVKKPWAIFPMLYKGKPTTPSVSNIDTNNIMHKREVGRFPIHIKASDEHWVKNGDQRLVSEQLIDHPVHIVRSRPLVIYEIEGNHLK